MIRYQPLLTKKLGMEDYVAQYTTTQPDWHPATQNWYAIRLREFCKWCRAVCNISTLQHITGLIIARYLSFQRAQNLSWSTRNGTYTALQAWFRWLAEYGIINHNPFTTDALARPRKPRRVPRTIPVNYIQQMIDAARADVSILGQRDTAIMLLMATTGMRRNEITTLHLNDIDFDAGLIHIRGKFDNERRGILLPVANDALLAWLNVRPPVPHRTVFCALHPSKKREQNHPLRPDAINDICTKYRNLAQLPPVSVSPHKWRHTFATCCAEAGDPWALQILMGHTNMSTTGIYVTPQSAELRRVAQHGPKIK